MKKGNYYLEKNKKTRLLSQILTFILLISSVSLFIFGNMKLKIDDSVFSYASKEQMIRDLEYEDYDEDYQICEVRYYNEDGEIFVNYSYDEYQRLDTSDIIVYRFIDYNGNSLYFQTNNPTSVEINQSYKQLMANKMMPIFNLAISLLILAISLFIMVRFGSFFSTYEKCWFLLIMLLATIFAVIFPEESANGVNGIVIMLLYLLDTFLNILCELLISKQSRINFIVSVFVEITEIVMCLVLMYRFATMAVTLFFWLPIDIISFINWSKHKDDVDDDLTIVRKLKGYQELLVIAAIIVWTIVVGYFISGLDITTDFINNNALEKVIIYLDACASAVGIANGLFIFFRLSEQWIAWYICSALETIINILTGQYVLLVLKLGFFTNTTYGYIKWNKYIKEKEQQAQLDC